MTDIDKILEEFDENAQATSRHVTLSFTQYLEALRVRPELLLRDIFQLLHDMVQYYVPEGIDEYPTIRIGPLLKYDFYRLFVRGAIILSSRTVFSQTGLWSFWTPSIRCRTGIRSIFSRTSGERKEYLS